MKRNNAQNSSAKKKLIPAVAMFTASAVMLSTATYAWFTMNKNAKVTGLNMTATAGGSIEISLGEIEDNGTPKGTNGVVVTPTMGSKSWKNVIAVSDYYSTIEKLKPASSTNANNLFYVADEDVYAGGKEVEENTTVKQTIKTDDEAKLVLQNETKTGKLDNAESGDCYYVDVPVWIRTTKQEDLTVKCDVTITDPKEEMTGSENGSELQKAVRVAIIPTTTESQDVDANTNDADAPKIDTKASYDTHGIINVFSTDEETYRKATKERAISKATDAATTTTFSATLADIEYTRTVATDKTNANSDEYTPATANVFTLKAAKGDNTYSVQPFVVRVWLEGESTSCKDANASQDWDIQLNFTAVEAGN